MSFPRVPPDFGKVAEAFRTWDAFELEETANAAGLPACVARGPQEWLAHPQGSLLAGQPIIGLTRIGDAAPRELGPSGPRRAVSTRRPASTGQDVILAPADDAGRLATVPASAS